MKEQNYVEGWKLADKLGVPMVDEHYYQTPGWFLNNQDFYDKYDRSKKDKKYTWANMRLISRDEKANIENCTDGSSLSCCLGTQWRRCTHDFLCSSSRQRRTYPMESGFDYFNNREVKPTNRILCAETLRTECRKRIFAVEDHFG